MTCVNHATQTTPGESLTPDEVELLGCFRGMDDVARAIIIDMAMIFVKSSEKVSRWADSVIADLEKEM